MHDYEYLAHYGTKGMEWGKRLFQNKDGSLTPLGRVHYGVGEARKKAVATVKKAPKAAGDAVKKIPSKARQTMQDLAWQRRQHNISTTQRRAQVKKERFESKKARIEARAQAKKERFEAEQARREARAQALSQKLIERESKKTLKQLAKELDDAKMNAARNKVSRLAERKARIYEKAMLKEQARRLKAEAKNAARQAKKDARRKYSNKDIKDLTDEELNARITRLKNEATLRALEVERAAPTVSAGMKWLEGSVGKGLSTGVDKLTGTVAIKVGKNLLNLSDDDIALFKSLTKK